MKATYNVVNSELFSQISNVEIEVLTNELNVEIEFNDGTRREFQGEMSKTEFVNEYGFEIEFIY